MIRAERTGLIAATFVCVFLWACGSGKTSSDAPVPVAPAALPERATPAPASGPAWSLSFRAPCTSASPETCAGAYGFRVLSDGTFRIGPGPHGELLEGWLSGDDLRDLVASITPSASSGTESAESTSRACPDGSVCVSGGAARDEVAIKGTTAKLVARYYPDRFPGPCSDAAGALERIFASVRVCAKDADCTLLGDDFVPVASRGDESAAGCDTVPTLPSANAFTVVVTQRELVLTREIARALCSSDSHRPFCPIGSGTRAVCVSGACAVSNF
jgi:hypothetical protein